MDNLETVERLMRVQQAGNDSLGIFVKKVSPEIVRKRGLKNTSGIIVTKVVPGKMAHHAGLRCGDVIFRAGNEEVNDPKKFNEIISKNIKAGEIILLVRNQEQQGSVMLMFLKIKESII